MKFYYNLVPSQSLEAVSTVSTVTYCFNPIHVLATFCCPVVYIYAFPEQFAVFVPVLNFQRAKLVPNHGCVAAAEVVVDLHHVVLLIQMTDVMSVAKEVIMPTTAGSMAEEEDAEGK